MLFVTIFLSGFALGMTVATLVLVIARRYIDKR